MHAALAVHGVALGPLHELAEPARCANVGVNSASREAKRMLEAGDERSAIEPSV
jgi:hypothetical protein